MQTGQEVQLNAESSLPRSASTIPDDLATWLGVRDRNRLVTRDHGSYGDRRIQSECHKDFKTLDEKVRQLTTRLEEFMRVIRPIGSSSGLIEAAKKFQAQLNRVLQLFQSNSAEIWREFSWCTEMEEIPETLRFGPQTANSAIQLLPVVMYDLAKGLDAFLHGISDIPEFSDKRLTDALKEFRSWIVYRAWRMSSHRYQKEAQATVRESTIRQYIWQTMREMTNQIPTIEKAFSKFVEGGVTITQDAQEKSQSRFQNMSTVATFLSAVTATTMQYTMSENSLGAIVMGLWLSSLILSIASAIISQLVIHWRAAMYRSPRSALPFWMSVCFDHTTLLCLVGAVLAFSAGLVVWTAAADLALAVKTCVGLMTFVTFGVILTVIYWELAEWRRNNRNVGKQISADADLVEEIPDLVSAWRAWKSDVEGLERRQSDQPKSQGLILRIARALYGHSIFQGIPSRPSDSHMISGTDLEAPPPKQDRSLGKGSNSRLDDAVKGRDAYDMRDLELHAVTSRDDVPPAWKVKKRKFYRAVRKAIMVNQFKKTLLKPIPEVPFSSQHEMSRPDHQPPSSGEQLAELEKLHPVCKLPIFHPDDHDIHFSPDGKKLAVGMLKGGVAICDVGAVSTGNFFKTRDSVPGARGTRFAWSPDSSHLAMISKDGVLIKNMKSASEATSEIKFVTLIAWLQCSSKFITVAGDSFWVLDRQGQKQPKDYPLPMIVHDIASVPSPDTSTSNEFVLLVGTMRDEGTSVRQSQRPTSALAEHCLMIIRVDLETSQHVVLAKAPTLADARHICVSGDGNFALISYRDKNGPTLWRLQDQDQDRKMRLIFRGRYSPNDPEPRESSSDAENTVSGKAQFCGTSDEWVMATDG
ncbi:hypothetical protein FRB90_001203, partial [Tulasnella sp. 427]